MRKETLIFRETIQKEIVIKKPFNLAKFVKAIKDILLLVALLIIPPFWLPYNTSDIIIMYAFSIIAYWNNPNANLIGLLSTLLRAKIKS